MRCAALAGLAFLIAGPALAQDANAPGSIRQPGAARLTSPGPRESVFEGQPVGIENGGPGSTGTLAHSGLGAVNVTNNSAETLNSSTPERGQPNTGGGGGGGEGGE